MANEKAKPVKELRMGKIKAAIWANDTEYGVRHNVTFTRLYKTDKGWESTASFGRDDLPLLVKVANQAHDWLFSEATAPTASQNGTPRAVPASRYDSSQETPMEEIPF